MSGPKHLWSGDWQQESEAASEDRATQRATPADDEPTLPAPRRPPAPHRGLRRAVPVTLVAVAFLAAAAIGLTALLSSSGHKTPASTQAAAPAPHRATPTPQPSTPTPQPSTPTPQPSTPATPQPSTPTTPQPTVPTTPQPAAPATTPPAVSTQQVSWLGMQIETLPPGAAVIETVKLGGQGDRAGLNPGDVIVAVNNRAINGAGSIVQAVQGLHSGDQVPIEVSHGSALEQVNATLAAPPSVHP